MVITTEMIADAIQLGHDFGSPFDWEDFIPNSEIWAAYCNNGGSYAATARFFNGYSS